MCHLSFSAGVIIAVSFEEVNRAPNAKSGSECDHEGLKGCDCAGKKCHTENGSRTFYNVVILFSYSQECEPERVSGRF